MPIISKETWDKFTQEEKQEVIEVFQSATKNNAQGKVWEIYEGIFPKEALQPKLTYEDVARELFEYDGIDDKSHSAIIPCMGMKWDNKLQAIGRLLVVAKFLNKDWKPDWSDGEQEKYFIGIDNSENKKLIVKKAWFGQYEIVYFRTEELAKQAVTILGENTVRLALSSDY